MTPYENAINYIKNQLQLLTTGRTVKDRQYKPITEYRLNLNTTYLGSRQQH